MGDDLGGGPGAAATSALRVLVVDPDPTHRLLACRLLERLGAVTETAPSAEEALRHQAFVGGGVQLVLVDTSGSGSHARWMREATGVGPAGAGAPPPLLVAMTVEGHEELEGFDAALTKPVSVTALRAVLEQARARPASARSSADQARGDRDVLDREVLRRLVDDLADEQLVRDAVLLYLAELPQRVGAVRSGLAAGDAAAVRTAAHSLKSASALLGASRLAAQCLALERAAAQEQLPADVDELAAQADRVAVELRGYVERGA